MNRTVLSEDTKVSVSLKDLGVKLSSDDIEIEGVVKGTTTTYDPHIGIKYVVEFDSHSKRILKSLLHYRYSCLVISETLLKLI